MFEFGIDTARGEHACFSNREMRLLLNNPRFRLVWLVGIFDEAGLLVYFTVHGWLALIVTDSAFWVGATAAMNGMALMLFSLMAGVLADRVARRMVLIVSMSAQAGLAFTTAILIFTDRIELWHVLVIAFLRGSAGAVKLPSKWAVVLDVVDRKDLLQATAVIFVGGGIIGIVMPTLAGVVVQSFDIAWAYVIMGVAWLLGPITLLGLRSVMIVKGQHNSPFQDFKQGVRYVFTTSTVRTLLLMGISAAVFGWGVEAMLPVMVRDVLHAGPAGVGYMFSAASFGVLMSTLVISSMKEIKNKGLLLVAGYVGFGVFLIAFALSPWLLLSLVLMGLVGVSAGAAETSMDTLLQSTVPDEIRGRVMSFRAFSIGASGSSGFYTGGVALFLGAPVAIAIGGVVLVLHGIRMTKGLSRRFQEQPPGDASPGNRQVGL